MRDHRRAKTKVGFVSGNEFEVMPVAGEYYPVVDRAFSLSHNTIIGVTNSPNWRQ